MAFQDDTPGFLKKKPTNIMGQTGQVSSGSRITPGGNFQDNWYKLGQTLGHPGQAFQDRFLHPISQAFQSFKNGFAGAGPGGAGAGAGAGAGDAGAGAVGAGGMAGDAGADAGAFDAASGAGMGAAGADAAGAGAAGGGAAAAGGL